MNLDTIKTPSPISPQDCCGSRQSGKAVLRDLIERHRRAADQLQVLHDMLPERPTNEQDNALWNFVQSLHRP
jgi:hypothetical protein